MSAVHYLRNSTLMLPSRPINAAGELNLLMRADDFQLAGATLAKLRDIPHFLTTDLPDEIL